MIYKLHRNGKGYVEDRQSIFCDITKEVELPILLPTNMNVGDCDVIARVVDQRGRQHDFILKANEGQYALSLPKVLLCPQLLQVSVHIAKNGDILNSFVLEPLRISSFGDKVELQRVIQPALLEHIEQEIISLNNVIYEAKNDISTLIEADMQKEKLILKQRETILQQQEQIKLLADNLQTVTKQLALIEGNYSILETIGGNTK